MQTEPFEPFAAEPLTLEAQQVWDHHAELSAKLAQLESRLEQVRGLPPQETAALLAAQWNLADETLEAIARVESEIDPMAAPAEAEINGKTRTSFLALILGMAIVGFKYDPKDHRPSTVYREIADALATKGISITDETVRRHLTEARMVFALK